MANAILNGAACGYAAANGTPCTSEEVLAALARDAEAQRAKVEAVLPQAAAADAELTKKLVEELERNTGSNESLVKAILLLASRATPAPPTSSSPPLPPAPSEPAAPAANAPGSALAPPPPTPGTTALP